MIDVDPEAPRPPYEQVRASLAERIVSGELAAGTRLPPVRTLAAQLGLAANTVARAYRELESAGLVETHGRGGTLVSARGDQALRDLQDAAAAYAALARSLTIDADVALRLAAAALGVAQRTV